MVAATWLPRGCAGLAACTPAAQPVIIGRLACKVRLESLGGRIDWKSKSRTKFKLGRGKCRTQVQALLHSAEGKKRVERFSASPITLGIGNRELKRKSN